MVRVTADVKETTRERLLAAAAQEFARAGFERANVDAISLAAGYAKGTIYNYFPSKEELFLAVIEQALAQAAATGPAPRDAPARERLTATLAGFCGWAGEQDALARVLVRECLMGTPGLYPQVIGAEWPLTGVLEAIIAEGMHDGEFRSDVPADLLALAAAGLTDLALAQHWASGGTRPSLADIPALVLTLLLGRPHTRG
jgi:AcrR family transcriptional regulator